MRINRKPNVDKYRKSKEEKQAQKLALEELNSYKKDNYWKFRAIGPRYGIQKMGSSEARYFSHIVIKIRAEIVQDGLTIEGILPRVHELLTEEYGKPIGIAEFNIDKSILDKSPQEQKEFLLKTGEFIIYSEIIHRKRNENAGTYTRPKGLRDIIGGAYGNTAIRMETVHTPLFSGEEFREWIGHMLYLKDDKLTIPGLNKSIFYEQLDSITVDKDSPSDMGFPVTIRSSDSNRSNLPIIFRTPIALGLEVLLKEKISKKNAQKDSSSNVDELKMCLELYEKGLLTEEEFNTKKKELLGL